MKNSKTKKINYVIVGLLTFIMIIGGSLILLLSPNSNKNKFNKSNFQSEINLSQNVQTNYNTWEFSDVGAHEFKVPYTWQYQVELWGVGSSGAHGRGGYTKGVISLTKDFNLFIYIGNRSTTPFNGGGGGVAQTSTGYNGAVGGGAADIRLLGGDWDNEAGLRSRIMVAGGGGGAEHTNYFGGHGGGLNGGDGTYVETIANPRWATGATQVSGGTRKGDTSGGRTFDGSFGKAYYNTENTIDMGGYGGGGYYGGGSAWYNGSGGGGSSFISGYPGCIAIESENSTNPKAEGDPNRSIHYSGLAFTSGVMKGSKRYKI